MAKKSQHPGSPLVVERTISNIRGRPAIFLFRAVWFVQGEDEIIDAQFSSIKCQRVRYLMTLYWSSTKINLSNVLTRINRYSDRSISKK